MFHPWLPPLGMLAGQVREHMNPRISLVKVLGVLCSIAACRHPQLSATESIAALQQEISAPGRLCAEFAAAGEGATDRSSDPSRP
ncbi:MULTISPECIES: hypothetical protein [unclassified Streptomyces]|uniref:hypothetical protein n=1 Tax=unclassified Streptomyces TaxID=2593676 RepID=UPI004041DBF1